MAMGLADGTVVIVSLKESLPNLILKAFPEGNKIVALRWSNNRMHLSVSCCNSGFKVFSFRKRQAI